MTNSITNCYQLLRPLHLYALSGNTLVDAELAAYDAGFALVEDALNTLVRETLIQTATGYGLSLREQIMGLWLRRANSNEKRRELLLYRLSVAPNDYNLVGMHSSMRAAGLNAKIVEDIPNERIRIIEDGYISDFENIDAVLEDIRHMMPAHLDADFEIGNYTWAEFETACVICDEFDAKDVTWGKLDIDGATIFGGSN